MFDEIANETLAELFAGFGSALALLIVAVLVAVPTAPVCATIAIVAFPPAVSVPIEHVTVVVPLQVP